MIEEKHHKLYDSFQSVVANTSRDLILERIRLVYPEHVVPADIVDACEEAERLFGMSYATDARRGDCYLIGALYREMSLADLRFMGKVEVVSLASLEPVSGIWLVYRLNCIILGEASSVSLSDPKTKLSNVRFVFTLPKQKTPD